MSPAPIRFRIVSSEQGMMLRHVLSKRLSQYSLKQAAQIIKGGGVYIDNIRIRVPSVRVADGERVTVYPQAAEISVFDPSELEFVYRDPYFVVVRKPANVPLTATKASVRGTISQALIQRLHQEGVLRPYIGLVHGLEQAASGLVLFTVRGHGSYSIHSLFRNWPICRSYRVRIIGSTPSILTCDGTNSLEPIVLRRVAFVETSQQTETIMQIELTKASSFQITNCLQKHGFELIQSSQASLYAWKLNFTHPITQANIEIVDQLPTWAQTPNLT